MKILPLSLLFFLITSFHAHQHGLEEQFSVSSAAAESTVTQVEMKFYNLSHVCRDGQNFQGRFVNLLRRGRPNALIPRPHCFRQATLPHRHAVCGTSELPHAIRHINEYYDIPVFRTNSSNVSRLSNSQFMLRSSYPSGLPGTCTTSNNYSVRSSGLHAMTRPRGLSGPSLPTPTVPTARTSS